MIKLKDLLKEELTDADIKVGDAYYRKTHVGYVVSFVYDKSIYGGWTTIEYQFKPQLPFCPGGEVAGVVCGVVDGVTVFKICDEVIGMAGNGGFADQIYCFIV